MTIRGALKAGSWYPRYKPDLLRELKDLFTNKEYGPGEEPYTLNQKERTTFERMQYL